MVTERFLQREASYGMKRSTVVEDTGKRIMLDREKDLELGEGAASSENWKQLRVHRVGVEEADHRLSQWLWEESAAH